MREVARTIDSPDDAPAALICRAAHALRAHLASAPVEASLRAIGWCDVDVRECVAALRAARRALGVAGLRRAGPHGRKRKPRLRAAFDAALRGPVQLTLF